MLWFGLLCVLFSLPENIFHDHNRINGSDSSGVVALSDGKSPNFNKTTTSQMKKMGLNCMNE